VHNGVTGAARRSARAGLARIGAASDITRMKLRTGGPLRL
jgi:hypothetical protein